MQAPRLKRGDVIGIVSPSHLVSPGDYDRHIAFLEGMGYRVKTSRQLFTRGWEFSATPEARAESFREMALDDSVKLVLFDGGEGADDVIPLIDYELVSAHPKLYMSFSDGTSVLNAIREKTGLEVYYGQTPLMFPFASDYERENFEAHIVRGGEMDHLHAGDWTCLRDGRATGRLTGGYLDNYTYLANGGWIVPEERQDYILFIEEHVMFFRPDHVSDELARLENAKITRQVKGVLFGNYAEERYPELEARMKVFADRLGIPCAKCDDFGHGQRHAVLRIGADVYFDAGKGILRYL